MKTDDLIKMLAEDAPVQMRMGRAMLLALLIGTAISTCLLLATIGIRPDMGHAMQAPRVMFKLSVTVVLAVAACGLVFRIGRPGMPLTARRWALAVPLLLAIGAVTAEMMMTPEQSWPARMMGNHARFCVFFVPVLSIAPLIGFMLVLRSGAPERPGVAGAVAGLAASGIAAAIYAWHCPDDSPFFVASWYTLAIAIVTLVGFVVGRRILRW